MKKIKIRITIYMIVSVVLVLTNVYYVLCFCFTYTNSRNNWMNGIYIGIIMDYMGIKLAFPLVKVILRALIKNTLSHMLIRINKIWMTIMAYMKPKRI